MCDCEVADETIKFSMEDMSKYKVNVVCTDLGLTSLPSCLPPDTIYLNMANNQVAFHIFDLKQFLTSWYLLLYIYCSPLNIFVPQVSSLDLLSNLNADYKSIERLILRNNYLKSLQGLENPWLQRNGPVLLDVRDNFITQVIGYLHIVFNTFLLHFSWIPLP